MKRLPEEPRWIGLPALLAIHAQQIERYGGGHGVLYPDVALSTLARVPRRWAERDQTDLADLAAMYLVGFVRSPGFVDGNKRTGLACALVFLALNGVRREALPIDLYTLVREVANGKRDDRMVAAFFRALINPESVEIVRTAPPLVVRLARESSLV